VVNSRVFFGRPVRISTDYHADHPPDKTYQQNFCVTTLECRP
jgi:hypothetical protein